ncbi:SAM-dependent methyltransferase, partial [Streptosporangium algeriense]
RARLCPSVQWPPAVHRRRSHPPPTDTLPDEMRQAIDTYYRNPGAPLVWRSRETVERFFDGLEPVSPGLVAVEKWTDPDAEAGPWLVTAGMARKP